MGGRWGKGDVLAVKCVFQKTEGVKGNLNGKVHEKDGGRERFKARAFLK